MKADWVRSDILVLDGALSDEALEQLIDIANNVVYEEQELGRGLAPHRARQRATTESAEINDLLWLVVRPHVNPIGKWFADGPGAPRTEPGLSQWIGSSCNPRSRFYRYSLGGNFSEHEDEPWKPNATTRSFLTVLVYLPINEPCIGGETVIDGEVVAVKPGRVVVFPHGLLHEGRPVERGEKLVLRNDIVGTVMRDERPGDDRRHSRP